MSPEIAKKVQVFFAPYAERQFYQGHILIHAGEDPAGIFYLTKGSVRQYDITDNGDEVVVNVFKPFAFFPMSFAINRTPNEYFFEAAEDITVQRAPLDAVVTFLKENPDVAFDLLARVYSGTDGLLRRLAHLMGGTAMSRLIFELIVMCRRFGKPGVGDECLIVIKEAELAARAGLTRETVNRQLHELRDQGYVKTTHTGLIITSIAELEKKLGTSL